MKDLFKEFISEPTESKYIEVKKYSGVISQKQAFEDFDEFCYVINNSYSGKEYWERKGIPFDSCYKQIKNFILNNDKIYISDFCKMLHEAFDVGIIDNHLSFASPLTGRLHFAKKYSAYFSELVVKRVNHKYVVVKSLEPNVKVGAYITDKSTLYPTLSTNKEEYFLVGCRSWNDINLMSVSINNINTQISVHRCKAVNKTENKDVCLNEYSLNNISVVRSNCCDYIDSLIKDMDISYIGKKYADSEKLIWNNLSNEGGYSRIPKQFIYGLNNYVSCEEYCAKLISPLTEGVTRHNKLAKGSHNKLA